MGSRRGWIPSSGVRPRVRPAARTGRGCSPLLEPPRPPALPEPPAAALEELRDPPPIIARWVRAASPPPAAPPPCPRLFTPSAPSLCAQACPPRRRPPLRPVQPRCPALPAPSPHPRPPHGECVGGGRESGGPQSREGRALRNAELCPVAFGAGGVWDAVPEAAGRCGAEPGRRCGAFAFYVSVL